MSFCCWTSLLVMWWLWTWLTSYNRGRSSREHACTSAYLPCDSNHPHSRSYGTLKVTVLGIQCFSSLDMMLLHNTFYGWVGTTVHKKNVQWNLVSTKYNLLVPICCDCVKRFLFRMFLHMLKHANFNNFSVILNGSVKKFLLQLVMVLPSNLIMIVKSIAGMIQTLNDHFFIY